MIRVAGITPGTEVNGPGERVLLSLQGCTLACPGCFNPHTHPSGGGRLVGERELAEELLELQYPLHLTLSGGEPLQQAQAVHQLLRELCFRDISRNPTLKSFILFSGFTLEEAEKIPQWSDIMAFMDAAVLGRYEQAKLASSFLRGSTNQQLFLPRWSCWTREDFDVPNDAELHIRNGQQRITGFPTKELLEGLCQPL